MKTPKIRLKTEFWNETSRFVWMKRMNKLIIAVLITMMINTAYIIMTSDSKLMLAMNGLGMIAMVMGMITYSKRDEMARES